MFSTSGSGAKEAKYKSFSRVSLDSDQKISTILKTRFFSSSEVKKNVRLSYDSSRKSWTKGKAMKPKISFGDKMAVGIKIYAGHNLVVNLKYSYVDKLLAIKDHRRASYLAKTRPAVNCH